MADELVCLCQKGENKPHVHVAFQRPQDRGLDDYIFYSNFGINCAYGFCVRNARNLKTQFETALRKILDSKLLVEEYEKTTDVAMFSLMVIRNGTALEAMDWAARVAGDTQYLIPDWKAATDKDTREEL